MKMENRRNFLEKSSFGLVGSMITYSWQNQNTSDLDESYPSTALEDIRAVVGAAHTQFDRVKELVSARPELAKATYDWGFGDVESALGAASHMGRKDIAELLMDHGARADIFTLAMLGKIDAVRSIIESMPRIQKVLGPHGFTLMHHAKIRLTRESVTGKEKTTQEELVKFLDDLGDADNRSMSLTVSKSDQEMYSGTYSFGHSDEDQFVVESNSRGQLAIRRGSQFGRALLRVGDHSFAPGGAPSVRITFAIKDQQALSLTIHDPTPIITITRD